MSRDLEAACFSLEAARPEVRVITHRPGLAATAVALLATAVISFAAPI